MDRKRRSSLAVGLFLVLLGVCSLVAQWVPGWRAWVSWPWIVVGVGVFLLVLGLLVGAPDLAVPACIVGGIGGLLSWQSVTGNWESWAYVWTLIPGFVGVGIMLAGLLGGKFRQAVRDGGGMVLTSLVLFAIFGSLFGALGWMGNYWPVLLILLGLLLLVRTLLLGRGSN